LYDKRTHNTYPPLACLVIRLITPQVI